MRIHRHPVISEAIIVELSGQTVQELAGDTKRFPSFPFSPLAPLLIGLALVRSALTDGIFLSDLIMNSSKRHREVEMSFDIKARGEHALDYSEDIYDHLLDLRNTFQHANYSLSMAKGKIHLEDVFVHEFFKNPTTRTSTGLQRHNGSVGANVTESSRKSAKS